MGNIKYAHWIMLEDAESLLTPDGSQAGFEASAGYLRRLCPPSPLFN